MSFSLIFIENFPSTSVTAPIFEETLNTVMFSTSKESDFIFPVISSLSLTCEKEKNVSIKKEEII